MNNASLRLAACVAVVVSTASVWRVATGNPQTPIKIGDGNLKVGGRPPMLMDAKVDLLVSRVEKLEAENAALKKQVSQLEAKVEKNTGQLGVTKLLLGGLDSSVSQLSKDYKNHTHEMGFGFSNPATVTNSPSNILVPWISAGQLKSGSNFRTGTPK